MKNSEKMRSLCEELNMSFDEASELFGEETLQSMQMAKIVGGNTNAIPVIVGWKLFCEIVGAVAAIVTIQRAITGSDVATVSPDAKVTVTKNSDGSSTVEVEGFVNKVQVITKEDTTTVIMTPTPKP